MFAHFSTPSVTCYPAHCSIHLLVLETSIESLLGARRCSRCRGYSSESSSSPGLDVLAPEWANYGSQAKFNPRSIFGP